jgi:hypothetical protein
MGRSRLQNSNRRHGRRRGWANQCFVYDLEKEVRCRRFVSTCVSNAFTATRGRHSGSICDPRHVFPNCGASRHATQGLISIALRGRHASLFGMGESLGRARNWRVHPAVPPPSSNRTAVWMASRTLAHAGAAGGGGAGAAAPAGVGAGYGPLPTSSGDVDLTRKVHTVRCSVRLRGGGGGGGRGVIRCGASGGLALSRHSVACLPGS